jgi:hypothetical protein
MIRDLRSGWRIPAQVFCHSQTCAFVNLLKLNFIHQSPDKFQPPTTTLIRSPFGPALIFI